MSGEGGRCLTLWPRGASLWRAAGCRRLSGRARARGCCAGRMLLVRLWLGLWLGLLPGRLAVGRLRMTAAAFAAFGGNQDHADLTAGGLKLKHDRCVDGRRRGRSNAELAVARLYRDQTLRGPAYHNALDDRAGGEAREARRRCGDHPVRRLGAVRRGREWQSRRDVAHGGSVRPWTMAATSSAASQLGKRARSGVWCRMQSGTRGSRRTMPASFGVNLRKFSHARTSVR